MSDYTIAEEFTLPSGGQLYDPPISPIVKLRSMTTEDEMKRLSPSERAYKNMCEIIDGCIVDDIGISTYDMCLADYQFLLHRIRVVTYGKEYKFRYICPYCHTEEEAKINLDELPVIEYDKAKHNGLLEFDLPKSGKHIVMNIQTPRMIDTVNLKAKEFKAKTKGTQGDSTLLFTLQSLIHSVDNQVLDIVKKEDFIRSLPMMDTNYILKKAEKFVQSFGVDTQLTHTCPICGLDYTNSFRLSAEFFGPSIDE